MLSCGLELVADEAQAEEPGSHCVFGIFVLLGLGAGGADFLGHLAQCEAKLNIALQLACVEAVLLAVRRLVELEEAELDRALGEGGVEVKHMVAAVVVVLASAVGGSVAGVPHIGKVGHGAGLFAVDLGKEVGVDRAAVAADSAGINVEGGGQKAFVAGHDVDQVAEGLRGVAFGTDVDVYSAASGGIALGSGLPQFADQLLQKLHVRVGEDRRDHFALFSVGAVNADILLEFPFPALGIPSTPGAVAVAAGGVAVVVGAEEGGGQLGGCAPLDVVHLDLDPDGLLFHFLNLSCYLCVHAVFLRFLCVFPFGSTHIRSTSEI